MLHRQVMAAALTVLLTFLFFPTITQAVQQRPVRSMPAPTITPAREIGGINTSRLSPKDLERWKTIEGLVFADDGKSQPLHPTIRGMWEWLETSGHTIYIEIIRTSRNSTC